MVEIKSIFIPDKIIIVENAQHQGYVVLPDKPSMLENAMRWAESYNYDYSISDWREREREARKISGIQHTYKNGTFKFKLCESASNSWNGGKLSFWNCTIIAPDGKEFLIGINQELLCNLLQSCTLVNGEVQGLVWLGKQRTNTGVYTETMPDFIQAKTEVSIKEIFKSKTSKYVVGDIVGSPTKQYLYAGVVYEHYQVYTYYDYTIHGYVGELTKLDEPNKKHMFIPMENDTPDFNGVFNEELRNKKTPYTVLRHTDYQAEELFEKVLNSRRKDVLYLYSTSSTKCTEVNNVANTLLDCCGTYQKFVVKVKNI